MIDKDLTKGSITKQLLLFSIPFLLSNLLQSLYGVIDMWIVGKFSGPVSIAAINNGGQVINLLTNVITSLCSGSVIIIGQYWGANKRDEICKLFQTLSLTLTAIGIVILSFILLKSDYIMNLIKVPINSYAETKDYLIITACGIFFIIGYNMLSSVMRGLGDSKHPLAFVTLACIINIVLDFILVAKFKFGAAGTAWGTILSQGISMLCCSIFLAKHTKLLQMSKMLFDVEKMKLIFKVGIPNVIQGVTINFSFLIMNVLVNEIGLNASAAVGVASKFNNFIVMPIIAMGASISALVAQNVGANQLKRAKNTFYVGMLFAEIFGICAFIITQFFPLKIITFFSTDTAVIDVGIKYLLCLSIEYMLLPILMCLNGLMLGTGHALFISVTSILTSVVVRIPIAYFFVKSLDWGINGVGLAAPTATFIGLLITATFFISGKWKEKAVII